MTASTATNTTSGGTECNTIAAASPAMNDVQVFMTYVAASVNHFARRTHGPVLTWYRAVTCSARRIASSTNETVGSSTHAASHGNDHTAVSADAKVCTFVIVKPSPSTIPDHAIQSTCRRTRSIRSATTSGSV